MKRWSSYSDVEPDDSVHNAVKQRIFFTNQVTTQSGQKRGVRLVRLGY